MYEKPVVDATFARAAEPITGHFATAVAALAAEHGVSIAAGVVEQNRDDLATREALAWSRSREST